MEVLESGQNYLEAVLMISEKKKDVHAIDIVNELNFSKPSVSIMLKKLENGGYLTIDGNNHLHLTESGMEIAKKIYERHLVLTDILKHLGIDDKIAEEDACKIEHDLSDVTFEKIKEYYNTNIKNK